MYAMKRRALVAIPLAMLALLVLASPTLAGVSWCRSDPIVRFEGTNVQVFVGIPEQYVKRVNGPVEVKFLAPRGTERELVFVDQGFNGYGETIWIDDSRGKVASDGSFDVEILVKVPIDLTGLPRNTKVPVEVRVHAGHGAPAEIVYGTHTETTYVTKVKATR